MRDILVLRQVLLAVAPVTFLFVWSPLILVDALTRVPFLMNGILNRTYQN